MSFVKKLRRILPGKRRKKSKYPTYAGRGKQPVMESKRSSPSSQKPARRNVRTVSHAGRWRKKLWRLFRWPLLIGMVVLGWFWISLPDIEDLNKFTKAPSILLKTENGTIIGSFGDIYGDYVPFDQLPTSLIDAVMATEDRNFYYHFGIDPFGLARAMVANIRAGL